MPPGFTNLDRRILAQESDEVIVSVTIGLISLSGASFALSRIRSVEPAAVFR